MPERSGVVSERTNESISAVVFAHNRSPITMRESYYADVYAELPLPCCLNWF